MQILLVYSKIGLGTADNTVFPAQEHFAVLELFKYLPLFFWDVRNWNWTAFGGTVSAPALGAALSVRPGTLW